MSSVCVREEGANGGLSLEVWMLKLYKDAQLPCRGLQWPMEQGQVS